MSDTVTRLAEIRTAIGRAERDFGREAGSVALVAVSKTKPAEQIIEVLAAGQRIFGENYVQEAKAKWPALKERFPDAELHMIGPLQSNKAREAVELFDVIQSLDRESLAKELAADQITVNAYCPGIVGSDMWDYNDREWGRLLGSYGPGELMAEWVAGIPLGRAGTSDDVANLLLFLASDLASYITGQTINIDGGMFMS